MIVAPNVNNGKIKCKKLIIIIIIGKRILYMK